MIITDKRLENNRKAFYLLDKGTIFDYKGSIYLKTENRSSENAFSFSSNTTITITKMVPCLELDAELILRNKL